MSEEVWKVRRVEDGGEIVSTEEMPENLAQAIYADWASNAKRFNDRSISLVRLKTEETVISTHTNTAFTPSIEGTRKA